MSESPIGAGVHGELLAFARTNGGVDAEALRDLLWLLNAHPRLTAFVPICETLRTVLQVLKDHVRGDLRAWGIEDGLALLGWVCRHRIPLARALGAEVDCRYVEGGVHPLRYRGLTRHAIYAALWSHQRDPALRLEYNLLLGHAVLAHARAMHRYVPRSAYEAHEAPGWPTIDLRDTEPAIDVWHFGYPLSPEAAGRALRRLSRTLTFRDLRGLDLTRSPPRLAVDSASYRGSPAVSEVLRFVRHCYGRVTERRRGGGGGGGGGKPIDPYRDGSEDLRFVDLLADASLDDGTEWLPTQVVMIPAGAPGEEPTPLECVDHLDLHPSEGLGAGYTLMVDTPAPGLAAAGPPYRANAQAKHLVRRGLGLPWDIDRLTPTEQRRFCEATEAALTRAFARLAAGDGAEIEVAAIFGLLIVFWMGVSLPEALDVRLDVRPVSRDEPLALFTASDEGGTAADWWSRPAYRPTYASEAEAIPEGTRATVARLYLPDASGLGAPLRRLARRLNRPPGAVLFDRRWQEPAIGRARRHLEALPGMARPLRLALVEQALYRDLLAGSGRVDIATAISGRETFFTGATVYYAAPSVRELQAHYRARCETVRCALDCPRGAALWRNRP